jgi:hypothetical protein
METEEIKGVIPEVRLPGAFGVNTFELYVSTKRLVFIQTSKGYQAVGGALGGAVGAVISQRAAEKNKKTTADLAPLQNVNLDELLKTNKGNKEFPLDGITELRLKKGMATNRLSIFGLKKNKSKLVLDGFLVPPQDYLKHYKSEGFKTKEISLQYVKEAESVMNSVLQDRIKSDY